MSGDEITIETNLGYIFIGIEGEYITTTPEKCRELIEKLSQKLKEMDQ